MKKLRLIITAVLMTLFSSALFAQSPSDVVGEYTLGEKNTIVKIENHNGVCSGKIIASDNPKAKIGKLMVKDLKQKDGKWRGKIYAPKRKEWYDAEFTPKENSLEITVKVGFMSKTMKWKRN